MSFRVKLKRIYKKWFETPGLREVRVRFQESNLQKFWNGEPVTPSPFESRCFHELGIEPVTITRRDESRVCVLVNKKLKIKLKAAARLGDHVQFAVTADSWDVDSRFVCRYGNEERTHTRLREGRWLDMRFAGQAAIECIEIETTQPVWLTCPRLYQSVNIQLGPKKDEPKHVVVLVLDGYARRRFQEKYKTFPHRDITPNIDKFFYDGFDAPNGFSSSEWTLPTTASFFTGQYASRHKMVHPTKFMKYQNQQKLLAEYFQEAGYHTLGFSCGNRLTPAFGSSRGFDRFIYHWPFEGRTTFDYEPERWIAEIIGHLDSHREGRTFTYAHFPDTHPAWNLGPIRTSLNLARSGNSTGHDFDALENSKLGSEQGMQLMLLKLYEFDRAIESLFAFIKQHLIDDALVVLTADHGSPWPDFHDAFDKSVPVLNEYRTGTFLKIWGSSVSKKLYTGVYSPNLDLMPTLLNACNIKHDGVLDGFDLLGNCRPMAEVVSESIYKGCYEISINSTNGQWIRKFPFNETKFKIEGNSIYAAGFGPGCTNFTKFDFQADHKGDQIIEKHIASLCLV